MDTTAWTVAQAKAKLSEVIEQAQARGPQAITRNGKKAAVLVSAEESGAQDPARRLARGLLRGLTFARFESERQALKDRLRKSGL